MIKFSPIREGFLVNYMLCLALMLNFQSCTSDNSPKAIETQSIFSSRSGNQLNTIDEPTARYAAFKLMNAPVDGKQVVQPRNVYNTVIIRNQYGEPVMYAVNFDSDGGYIIISASRKTTPVIASSDQGIYGGPVITLPFISRLIDRASAKITESFDYPIDSLNTYAEHWAALLPPIRHVPKRLRAASHSYQSIIDSAISVWESQGLEVYEAQKWLNNDYGNCRYLPDLDNLLAKLNMSVNWADGRPMNELSYIVVRHTLTYSTSGDKCDPVTTKWDVNVPYNAAVPGSKPLSSEAVALGKILHYFKDPSILDFSSSISNPLKNNLEVANFLYDVALNTHTVFGTNYSFSSYDNLQYAIDNHYKYSFKKGTINEEDLISSIDNGSPLIVIDYDKDGRSHAWVCDGYRVVEDRIDYHLMVPVGQPEDIFGPYEPSAQWDHYGNASFQFNHSDNDVKIMVISDYTSDQLRGVFYSKFSKL